MYRDDYILRMIARFGQVIAYLAGLRRQGQYPMALLAADEAMRQALGVGSDQVAGRDEREILALIRFADRDGTWRELAAYVAAILHAEAAIYEAQGDHQLVPARALLALQLLTEAELAGDALPEYAPPREHLLELLHGYHLPAHTRAALLQLYEREGAFARAEDALFALLADNPASAELRARGVALFERLLAHDDAALAAGGLSRAEVRRALAELSAI
jgi:L-alanine-DL-glutamate epimerase-like enolase superfamily enzyme